MGTPSEKDRHVATYDWGGVIVRDILWREFGNGIEILDVGAGWGHYRDLLPEWSNIDACEIWEPYVEDEKLRERYREVYLADICDLVRSDDFRSYDVVIMGDVFEHITRRRARDVIRRILDRRCELFIVTPYLYEQDEVDDNPYERHLQDDLTPERMVRWYPELRLVAMETRDNEPFKGLYRRAKEN